MLTLGRLKIRRFILWLVLTAFFTSSSGYRLNVPRVLLPHYAKQQVQFELRAEPESGCFFWSVEL